QAESFMESDHLKTHCNLGECAVFSSRAEYCFYHFKPVNFFKNKLNHSWNQTFSKHIAIYDSVQCFQVEPSFHMSYK
ncbi:hypothetical protein VIGAN_11220000, partial [Vigna angularis var. angularis]